MPMNDFALKMDVRIQVFKAALYFGTVFYNMLFFVI